MFKSRFGMGLASALAVLCLYALLPDAYPAAGQDKAKAKKEKKKAAAPEFPPKLPDGKEVHTATTDEFLKPTDTILKDVLIAKTAPTVDFIYYPGQTYAAKIWSNWGDGVAVNGKYYSSIGDHDAPKGNAYVYEYDPAKKLLRLVTDVVSIIKQMLGYLPGKIHGRLDVGKDGMLYFSTHRGGTTVTADKYGYTGDWILRVDPKTGKGEVVAHGPVPKHCIPCSVLDPDRLIFYGGTAAGTDALDKGIQFFAYDVTKRKVIYSGPNGPGRYMIFARSTGKIYFVPNKEDAVGKLVCFDPAKPSAPVEIPAELGLRSATEETPQGMVYTVSKGGGKLGETVIFGFNTKTEKAEVLGPAAVGVAQYVASIDADPKGRYLYYVPGAHGGADKDGSPLIQFDTKTKQRKVIAFLHPYFKNKIGATPVGTYGTAVDPAGDKVYITWNVRRNDGRAWDCCALTVVHIPESERQP